ncbi:bifunctional riboflavin kinase/FAD synthetase [Lichenihabitans sp. PAMC28606]|nr:bifunctional riboflavin kinase/FAD synthetase [Lichenihabitans sp. PAMC28606]UDL94964.1 bifunctional riboflavin kinase/FAD synthetase [Lichenihabitans sp. PAMC28606]
MTIDTRDQPHGETQARPSVASPITVYDMQWDHGDMPTALRGAVVAIGNFDGIHRGHKAVIERAKALAMQMGRPCAVCTFEPHPADYFGRGTALFRLTPETAKAQALSRVAVDGMIVLPFDARMAGLSAADFVSTILVERLGIAAAVVGYDFHFGKARSGTPAFLAEAGQSEGFTVEIIDKISADPAGDLSAVSSTAIRNALESGEVARAAKLLGHDYFVVGEVLHGQKLGRTLGYPTANMRLDPTSRLAHGIYAVTVRVPGWSGGGVASFGRRPTFDNGAPLLETYIFDYTGDLYGQTIEIGFVDWIRGEAKFDGIDDLIRAMTVDEAKARIALERHARGEPERPAIETR